MSRTRCRLQNLTILGALAVLSSGCSNSASKPPAADATTDSASATDSAPGSDATPGTENVQPSCDEKAKACASQFGALFTKANGRADGTLIAVVRPTDTQCTFPNATHVVLQLSILGQVQRLVVAVDGIGLGSIDAPLLGPAFKEGWHENLDLDYVRDLAAHSTDLPAVSATDAVQFICSRVTIGEPISVYAYSDGSRPASAHQIHRNDRYPDGAVVINPTAARPTYLLFRYADQQF
ncbi:MAG: hypothetical protein H6707_20405 [Deltaproteobacteria bacterium]|nr:hypothetical protein [Deltaproteobacteria bacterium]